MKVLILSALLMPLVAASQQSASVEVPPHFTFPVKPRICEDCGTVRELEIHNRFEERAGKGVLMGTVVGAPSAEPAEPGTYYRIKIDMDNGKTREINVENPTGLGMGAKVRVVNGNIEKMG